MIFILNFISLIHFKLMQVNWIPHIFVDHCWRRPLFLLCVRLLLNTLSHTRSFHTVVTNLKRLHELITALFTLIYDMSLLNTQMRLSGLITPLLWGRISLRFISVPLELFKAFSHIIANIWLLFRLLSLILKTFVSVIYLWCILRVLGHGGI